MALRIMGSMVKKEIIEDYIKQIPISDERVQDEIPFYFKIKKFDTHLQIERDEIKFRISNTENEKEIKKLEKELSEKEKEIENTQIILYCEIKQLTMGEWEVLQQNLKLLETSLELTQKFKDVNLNSGVIMEKLLRDFVKFVTIQNPEAFLNRDIIYILNSEYALQLEDKHYKAIIEELKIINFDIGDEFIKLKKYKNYKIDKIYKKYLYTLWKSNYKYTKNLCKKIMDYYVIQIFRDIKFTQLAKLISVVIDYNNVQVKKNLTFLTEKMGKAMEDAQNLQVSLSEKVILRRTGKTLQLEIK